jgi:hypothetical protein
LRFSTDPACGRLRFRAGPGVTTIDVSSKGVVMSEFIERQKPVIERTGMGLLPGIAVAFFLCMGMIAAIVTNNWWVILAVAAGIVIVAGTVMAVIVGLLGNEDDIYSHDG